MTFDVNFFWDHGPDATETSTILNSLKPSFVSQISSINISSDDAENIKNICAYCNDDSDDCDDCCFSNVYHKNNFSEESDFSGNYNHYNSSYNYKTGQKRYLSFLDSIFP